MHRIAYYYNARSWSTEYINRAKYYYEYLGLLKNAEKFNGIQSEYPHPNDGMYPENLSAKPKTVLGQTIRVEPKNPRNKLCSCNSGLKYKKCCGKKVSFIT